MDSLASFNVEVVQVVVGVKLPERYRMTVWQVIAKKEVPLVSITLRVSTHSGHANVTAHDLHGILFQTVGKCVAVVSANRSQQFFVLQKVEPM